MIWGDLGRSGGGLGAVLGDLGPSGGGLERLWRATGDHDGSKRLKEDLLEAKNRPRRPAGGQDFSKKPFWCHFVVHVGGLFLHSFGSKISSKIGSAF